MTTLSSGTILQSAIRSPLTITGSGVELAGLQLDSIAITLSGSGHHIHGCTFTGTSTLTVNSDCHDTIIEYTTFRTVSNAPMRGTPGNNITVRYNDVDLTNANTSGVDNDEEWLHFVSPCNGLSIVGNVIRGNRLRWAIELQTGMTNLKVQGNWIHAARGGSGISCATGGEATPPFANAGSNIDISGNIVLSDAALGCALEIDGDQNIKVHDNYFSGFLTSIVNGTGGQRGQGLMTSNNVLVYVTNPYADGDNTPWVVPPRTSLNDRVFKIGAARIPAPPPTPTNVGTTADGGSSSGSSGGTTVADLGLDATATDTSLTWTFNPLSDVGTLSLLVTGSGAAAGSQSLAKGATSALSSGLTPNWQYTATLTVAAQAQTATHQCLAKPGDANAADGTVATLGPPPAPAPNLATLIAAYEAAAGRRDAIEAQLLAATKAVDAAWAPVKALASTLVTASAET